MPSEVSPEVHRPHYRLTFVVLAVGRPAFSLLQSLVSPVLPLLQTNLHTTQNTVTWVLTAYLLSASVFTPILGRVGDMVGKEKVLVAVLAVLALGSILAALATSIGVMIIARAIQGVGGGVIPLSFGIIRDEFPREKVAGAVGIIAALLAVGGGVGLVLAGPIVNALDYPLAVLDPRHRGRAGRGRHPSRGAGVADPHAGTDRLAGRDAAVRLAGRPAARRQPGAGLGLGLGPGHRPAGRAGRPAGRSGPGSSTAASSR